MWTDIDSTIARIATMNSGAATADAAELTRIVDAAGRVAARLARAFESSPGEAGYAVDGASAAGRDLAERVHTSADALRPGSAALTTAAATLAGSAAKGPRILALRTVSLIPAMQFSVSQTIQSTMTGAYNMPMSSTASDVDDAASSQTQRRSSVQATATAPGTDSSVVGSAPALTGAGVTTASGPDVTGRDPSTIIPTSDVADSVDDAPGQTPAGVRTGGSPTDGPASNTSAATTSGAGSTTSTPDGSDLSPAPPAATGAATTTGLVPTRVSASGVTPRDGAAPRTTSRGTGPTGTAPTRVSSTAGATPKSAPGSAAPVSTAPRAVGATPAASPSAISSGPRSGSGLGGAPVGPGGRSRPDEQRRSAQYLRSVSEGELLLGAQPMVTPAVVGPPAPPPGDDTGGDDGADGAREDPTRDG